MWCGQGGGECVRACVDRGGSRGARGRSGPLPGAREAIQSGPARPTAHVPPATAVRRQVVVAEAAPTYGGLRMAEALAEAGVQTTLIPDAAIFAMMARMNKVWVGGWG